jgi:Helix-turn-helix domain
MTPDQVFIESVRSLKERVDRINPCRHVPAAIPSRRDCSDCSARRIKSLQQRALPAEPKAAPPPPRETGGYVPELADRLERDPRIGDGARRCARFIAAQSYRRNRKGPMPITVGYLAKAMGKARRTVQRYLRQLEAAGYIEVYVIPSRITRMCAGIVIALLKPLFPRHGWPKKLINPAMPFLSQIYTVNKNKPPIPRLQWVEHCRNGMDRALIALVGPLPEVLRL